MTDRWANAEERALRVAVLRGEEAAWRALYARSFAPLWAYVVARTGHDVPAAEEVAQETWMVAVRRIADFDPERGPFEGWLRGIAANVLRNRRRAAARAPRSLPLEDLPAPEVRAPEGDARERVALALTALPWAYQLVLRAKYEDRLPVTEIAARTGRTSKAVESLLQRAREAFRAAFGAIGTGDS